MNNDAQKRARILAALNRIRTANPRAPEMPRPTVELIIDGLMRDEPEDVELAVDLWIQRSRMFPHPSELRGVLDELAAARPPGLRVVSAPAERVRDAYARAEVEYVLDRFRGSRSDFETFDALITDLSHECSRTFYGRDLTTRARESFVFNHARYVAAVRAAGYDPFADRPGTDRATATIHPIGETDAKDQDADTQTLAAAESDDDELPDFPF